MKKIDFYTQYRDYIDSTPEPEDTDFPILMVLLYVVLFLPVLFGFFLTLILHIIQEIIILIFTIFSELIQLLKLAISRLFKLGDTK